MEEGVSPLEKSVILFVPFSEEWGRKKEYCFLSSWYCKIWVRCQFLTLLCSITTLSNAFVITSDSEKLSSPDPKFTRPNPDPTCSKPKLVPRGMVPPTCPSKKNHHVQWEYHQSYLLRHYRNDSIQQGRQIQCRKVQMQVSNVNKNMVEQSSTVPTLGLTLSTAGLVLFIFTTAEEWNVKLIWKYGLRVWSI